MSTNIPNQSSDTSSVQLAVVPEQDWGQSPADDAGVTTAPIVAQKLRFTGESLNIARNTTESEEITGNRQITDLIPTKVEATGDVNAEFSYGTYTDFIRTALCSKPWTHTADGFSVGDGIRISRLKANKPDWNLVFSQVSGGTVKRDLLALEAGQVISIISEDGSTPQATGDAANLVHTPLRVLRTQDVASVGVLVQVTPLSLKDTIDLTGDLTFDDGAKIYSSAVLPDKVINSFTIEKQFKDVKRLIRYTGMTINQMSITAESEQKITSTFSFIGKNGATSSDTSDNPEIETWDKAAPFQNPNAFPTTPVMSAGIQTGAILIDGKNAGIIKSWSLTIDNNLRGKPALGVIGNSSVGLGRISITGDISAYFKDFAIYEKYLNNEDATMMLSLSSPGEDSGTYYFYLPRIKFSDPKILAGGPDQDVFVEGGFQALYDTDIGNSLVLSRINN